MTPPLPFRRLAIVNRGEPAMRCIHAVRELEYEQGAPITVIALYTDPERRAMFVRHADEAYSLGPPLAHDSDGNHKSRYLDYDALERALVATKAEAVWVGWGFVAEHPEFVELCDRLGITFVGPDAAVMRRLGDKINAKKLAERADVPVAAWSGGPVETVEEALRHAATIGFPLMIKATAGGGGRGIRRVDAPDELPSAFESARAEARAAFGDPTVLMEKLITPARHIEVQIIADGEGGAWAVGVRDCSYQRRNQKVVEESSSPALTAEQEREIADGALRLVRLAGYRNAGTVEFLYEPSTKRFSFMEVNARLQVEHPVTEMVSGVDMVKLQLHVAARGRIEGDAPPPSGHAIEVRLNAEDPALGFAPTPGKVELVRFPTGPGVRVDAGIGEGDVIPAEFDSMIAKIIAWGRDRAESLGRLRRALTETVVVLDDGTTNQGFLLELLSRREVVDGVADTGWLDRLQIQGETGTPRHADVALLHAAIELTEAEIDIDRARFYALARRGRPQAAAEVGRHVDVRFRGQGYRLRVAQIGPSFFRVELDGRTAEVRSERLGPYERRLSLGDVSYTVVSSRQGADLLVEVDGVPHRVGRDERGLVRSLAPAVVVSIPVEAGDEVEAGDVVAVVESMKMESSLTAPVAGRVQQVLASANLQVGAHHPLVKIEPGGRTQSVDGGERVTFDALVAAEPPSAAGPLPSRCRDRLQRLEWLVLGYDVDAAEGGKLASDLVADCGDLMGCDPALVPGEHRLLDVWADLRTLTRAVRDDEDPEVLLARSAQEHLHAFLRSLDAEAEGLPERFRALLVHALDRYGVHGLERTSELERACYRIFLAQQRATAARGAVMAILEHRLAEAPNLAGTVGEGFRQVLDRIIAASEGRDRAVAELARDVRYRYFEEPIIASARSQALHAAERAVVGLLAAPDGPHRAAQIDAIVRCPQALAPMITARSTEAGPEARRALLEALTRRYYRVRSLTGFTVREVDGREFLCAGYDRFGVPQRVAVTWVERDELPSALAALRTLAADLPEGEALVADLYAARDGDRDDDALAASLQEQLAAADLPVPVRRLVVAEADRDARRGMAAVSVFTFRRGADGLQEDVRLRDLHPMMAQRLELWRLDEFVTERIPAPEDVYLFRGTARANPRDERLFAFAEVRGLTPLRDASGSLVALPELERNLGQALEAVRRVQSGRSARERLMWNRVFLFVWPVIDLSPDDLRALVGRYARVTGDLGVEVTLVRGRMREPGGERERLLRFFSPSGRGVQVEIEDPPTHPLRPLDEGTQRIVSARRRGTLHPAEIVRLLGGDFVEHDLDEEGRLVPVDRPPATNTAGIVVGLTRNVTDRHPEGMTRVALLGDPTKALGSLAEPECLRINKALDLAEDLGVPLEWFALSAGARIAMDGGTENMDWIAAVLRRIIEFTQRGNELNVVVCGINVGAQPYWNAEATMLMHTRGILVMTPDSAMVLTGKQSLDYSGGVSAEDNFGIGGYERIMGPNGQAQYWAPDLAAACDVLLAHYDHAYVAPGERFPRRATTSDAFDRDVRDAPHSAPGSELRTVGDIFSDKRNPARKLPFDIRSVMRAVADADHPPLERWAGMRDAEIAVVWDAHLGGWPVALLGIESRPLPRYGEVPADGPEQWTSGTLFPRSSKKIARAVNAASGQRPLVVLANLAGFDGSPESMRKWQLEYGAEIGRSIVNFDGPVIFCVVSRYHGGAFVVFSQKLNENLETLALEGSHASVIGGAPAAAVVFAREVDARTRRDPRIAGLDERIGNADGAERAALHAERATRWTEVRAEKLGELADEFDHVHSVERAVQMGSVSRIIPAATMRPALIEALERGIARTLERMEQADGREADGRARVAGSVAR